MWLVVVLGVVVVVGVVWLVRGSTPDRPANRRTGAGPRPAAPTGSGLFDLEAETARMLAEADAAVPDLMRQVEADAAALTPEPPEPEPVPEPIALAATGGPSWMPPEEWADRVAKYREQGRTDADIRQVAEHLERRGPRTPRTSAEQAARAKSHGYVARSEYLSPEAEAVALAPGPDGYPDAWLERVRDRLLVVTPAGWVNPKSRTAASRAGLWSLTVRGTSYHESAARRGDFRPGTPVRLVREPGNPHDPNAIAVYAERGRDRAGYVARGYAKRLARLLDSGADIVAVSTRGGGPGSDDVTPQILAAERGLWEHLNRER